MKGWRLKRREAVAGALRDLGCDRCGRVMEGEAAFTVHADDGRCLPDGACGQLVRLRDGRWGLAWRHPDIR